MPDNNFQQLLEYIQTQEFECAVFDFDGTMTYTEDLHWLYYHKMLDEVLGIDYPYPLHANTTGMRGNECLEWLSEQYGFDAADEQLVAYRASHPHHISGELISRDRQPYQYLPEIARQLYARGARLCLLSANDIFAIAERLHSWGLDEMFSAIRSVVLHSEDKANVLGELIGTGKAIVFDDAVHVLDAYGKYDKAVRVAIEHPFSIERFRSASNTFDLAIDVVGECDVIPEAKAYMPSES